MLSNRNSNIINYKWPQLHLYDIRDWVALIYTAKIRMQVTSVGDQFRRETGKHSEDVENIL